MTTSVTQMEATIRLGDSKQIVNFFVSLFKKYKMGKISEDRCSLEICKLLKERGFNEDTDYIFYYYKEDDDWCFEKLLPEDKFNEDKMLRCPTHQMALKWLREEHKIGIFPAIYEHTVNESKLHNYGVAIVNLEDFNLLDTDYFYSDTYDGSVDFSLSYVLQKFVKPCGKFI